MKLPSLSIVACALAGGAVALLSAPSAEAHFVLQNPPSWYSQDGLGSPQKLGPCGNEGGGTVTGMVTDVKAGDTITITITETIYPPAHSRTAIAQDPSQLPAEPVVTPGSGTPCGTVPIMNPPVFPVLA